MKKVILSIAIITLGFISCKNDKKGEEKTEEKTEQTTEKDSEAKTETNTEASEKEIDTENSLLNWKGEKPTSFHNGTIKIKEGKMSIKNDSLIGGTFVFDMNSIDCLDLKEDAKLKKDLEVHLKNEDFFDVTKFPTATFTMISFSETEGLKGKLKIKDVEKDINFPATISEADGVYTLEAKPFKVNRTEYGIKYKSKTFVNNLKDKFIKDEVEFSFKVTTKK